MAYRTWAMRHINEDPHGELRCRGTMGVVAQEPVSDEQTPGRIQSVSAQLGLSYSFPYSATLQLPCPYEVRRGIPVMH